MTHRAMGSKPEEPEMLTDKRAPSKTVETLDRAIENPNKLGADPAMVREPACLEGPTKARRLDTEAAAAAGAGAAKSDMGIAGPNPGVAEADSRIGYNKVATWLKMASRFSSKGARRARNRKAEV